VRALALVLLAACSKPDDGLTVTIKAPPVGSTITEEETTTQVTTLITEQRRTVITDRERKLAVEEIVAITGDAPTTIDVEYRALERSQVVDDGAAEATPSSLIGKRYRVWRDGDAVRASLPDGGAVSADELDELLEEHRELGEVPRVARLVGGRRWRRGERVVLTADDLATMSRSRGDARLEARSGALTWTAIEKGIATFDVEMVLVQSDDAKTIESELRTTVKMDVARGLPVEIVATGTTAGSLRAGQLAGVKIEGTIDGRSTYLHD
jgi:hypothetical protein